MNRKQRLIENWKLGLEKKVKYNLNQTRENPILILKSTTSETKFQIRYLLVFAFKTSVVS